MLRQEVHVVRVIILRQGLFEDFHQIGLVVVRLDFDVYGQKEEQMEIHEHEENDACAHHYGDFFEGVARKQRDIIGQTSDGQGFGVVFDA